MTGPLTKAPLDLTEADAAFMPEVADVAGVGVVDVALVPEVADVVDVGSVAVKRAVAAAGNTSLASLLMRVQKSGRRPD